MNSKTKHPVSPEVRQRVLDLRRNHSLSQVAEQTGLPIGTVKSICCRSGVFRDNLKHREFFSLPPIRESASTAIAVPELPPQQAATGDTEVDAVHWLQQVVSTGQPDLIAKAMEARKRIETPMAQLEKRYRDILIAQNPGNAFGVAFATFGFGELEDMAERAINRNVMAREALARFGSETGVFANTLPEDFCLATLKGFRPKKSGFLDLNDRMVKAFMSHPDYVPQTLGDCLHELAYWEDLSRLRYAFGTSCGDGHQECWVRKDFVFRLMGKIRPRSKDEALAVLRYMISEDTDAKDRDGADAILLNLIGGQ